MKFVKQFSAGLIVLCMVMTAVMIPSGGGEVASADSTSDNDTSQVTLRYHYNYTGIENIYYEKTVNVGEPISISPESAKDDGYADWWYAIQPFVNYWKLDGYYSGPYVIHNAQYIVFHDSRTITVEGYTGITDLDKCSQVLYTYSDGTGSSQQLTMYYESNQTSAPAQYCGFTTTKEGYQFVNWSVKYADKTTGTLAQGENIDFTKYSGTYKTYTLTANFAQPKLIVIPDNICVEKGGSYTLGYTAIGLDTSKYTMDLSWMDEGSSAKVGVYKIEIRVISILDKATGQLITNPYDTSLCNGTLTVYEGDHSTLVT